MATNVRTPGQEEKGTDERSKDNTRLENIASKIDPPGRELKDEDLQDPGRMTPGAQPTDNRS